MFSKEIQPAQTKHHAITYKRFAWSFFWICTWVSVIDRLWLNVWPMGINRPLSLDVVWGVQAFELGAWISGRITIVATSALFITQCRTMFNMLVDNRPSWLYVGDIHEINNQLHSYIGHVIGWATMVHIWFIFLAPIFSGTSMIYLTAQSMRKTVPFYDKEKDLLSIAPDDLWRLIEMTTLFGLVFPATMSKFFPMCRESRYTTSMIFHFIAATMYAVDIIRKGSHPHSKVFNIPTCFIWFFDRLAGYFIYRKCTASVSHYIALDDEHRYIALFLKADRQLSGGVVYLHFPHEIKGMKTGKFQYSHPFTIWSHRGTLTGVEDCATPKINFTVTKSEANIKHFEWKRQPTRNNIWKEPANEDGSDGQNAATIEDGAAATATEPVVSPKSAYSIPKYDYACVVKIIERTNGTPSWTQDLKNYLQNATGVSGSKVHATDSSAASSELKKLTCYGPYHTVFHNLYVPADQLPAMVFVGSGAGASPLIDFHQHIVHTKMKLQKPVFMIYTCNSPQTFEFVSSILMSQHIDNFYCRGWITQHKDDKGAALHSHTKTEEKTDRRHSRFIGNVNRRPSMSGELTYAKDELRCTDIFFCGSPAIQEQLVKLAKGLDMAMNMGHTIG